MKHSLKSIVKESLREAFYAKRPANSFEYKLKITVSGKPYIAIITNNNVPGEKDYKISLFKSDPLSIEKLLLSNYWDLDGEEAKYIILNKRLPNRFDKRWTGWTNTNLPEPNPSSDPRVIYEEKPTLNEELFLMEESVRELESFIDNKRPT